MISVQNLSMLYGARLLFDEVNINFSDNQRYGIVGANGTGKSTFLRLLAGDETPSLGDVNLAKRAKLGWLKQDQYRYEKNTAIETVLQGKAALWAALQEKEQILNAAVFDEKTGFRLGHLEEVIVHEGGYTAETFAARLLTGLGLAESYHHKLTSALSGGYKLRVLLAQALFSEPDILLLDEPTNHLDIMSIAWLEDYLKNEYKGTLIFISHDHSFLNNLSTHVLDIDYGEIACYVGNYDHFIQEKQQLNERKLQEKKYVEAKVAHMKAFIDRFKASAARSKQAMSREKMLDKIELPDIKQSSRIAPSFSFSQKRPSGKKILTVESISKSFEERCVLNNVSFSVNRGEKLAIIGHNGIGKSTLLKIILGQYTPDNGQYEWGYETQISYFAQDHHEQLNKSMTVLEWLTEARSNDSTSDAIRKTLGQMLFTQDEAHSNVLNISGGEAARLLFANIILLKGNILVLDEPTNHLDLESRSALAEGLKRFEGTVIFVSHDRYFVSHFATRILAFTEKGPIDFQGNYTEYLNKYGGDYLSQAWVTASK
jgi:ATPase subunit of ABC transporter with duplicated ATPase domains